MKKTLLLGVSLLIIISAGLVSSSFLYKGSDMSSLLLDNIEALADNESTSKKYDCYSILQGISGQTIACNTCQMADGIPPWYHFGSKCTRK